MLPFYTLESVCLFSHNILAEFHAISAPVEALMGTLTENPEPPQPSREPTFRHPCVSTLSFDIRVNFNPVLK